MSEKPLILLPWPNIIYIYIYIYMVSAVRKLISCLTAAIIGRWCFWLNITKMQHFPNVIFSLQLICGSPDIGI